MIDGMKSHPPIDPAALVSALRRRDLPAPVDVRAVGVARLHAIYRLKFDNSRISSILLRRVIHCPGWDTLATERAALKVLEGVDEVPTVSHFDVLDSRELGFPAAFVEELPGVSGAEWIEQSAKNGVQVVGILGRIRQQLDAFAFARPAMCGTGSGGFLPQRSSWRGEWAAFHGMWSSAARHQGTTLGSLSDALEQRFHARLPSLDTADAWTLVHRDLQPENVLLVDGEAGFRLSGVVDWSGAMVGDPLVDWLQALQMPDDWLRAYGAGLGAASVERALREDDLARLEAYFITRCVARLSLAGMPPYFGRQGRLRAQALDIARTWSERALAPNFVRDRLRIALGGEVDERRVVTQVAPTSQSVGRRRSLERLRFIPLPLDNDADLAMASLALFDRAGSSVEGQNARRLAHYLLDRCVAPISAAMWEPVPDAEVWRSERIDRCLSESTSERVSAIWTWLGLRAIDGLDGTVSDPIRRGLEAAVELQLTHESRIRNQVRTRDTLVGALAWLCLNQAHGEQRFVVQRRAAEQAAIDAWDLIDPFPVSSQSEGLPGLSHWPPVDWAPGGREDTRLCVLFCCLQQLEVLPIDVSVDYLWCRMVAESQVARDRPRR